MGSERDPPRPTSSVRSTVCTCSNKSFNTKRGHRGQSDQVEKISNDLKNIRL